MAQTFHTMQQVPADHPVMIAWEAWKKTVAFQNARRWAGGGQHVEGSLWAAFDHGFLAASLMPHPNPPGGPEANPAGEALYQASLARSLAEVPEEDRAPSSLEDAVRFIERWIPESLPASDTGQVSFGRALLEMALGSMKAALAQGEAA